MSGVLAVISGSVMTINFLVFWAIPVAGMGSLYKELLKKYLQPIYFQIEGNALLRKFASSYIYTKPQHADYFAMALLTVLSCSISIPTVFYWQLSRGYLPWWLIFAYYCSWVGMGGSIMGTAYTMAHKEGHNIGLYQKSIRYSVGNFFENYLGLFFGNVPWNFTTSHIHIHHRLDGGVGDSFYEWDFDRSSVVDFMKYVHRVLFHTLGTSSIKYFRANGHQSKADLLYKGAVTYWAFAVILLAVTRSFSFVFWIYLQPFLCMTYFLALINIGFHGMIEFDKEGKLIPSICSSTIIDGEDDLFGEDDHMAHHHQTGVYYRDLPALQKSKIEEFKKHKSTVFKKLSIVELSIFTVLGLWDKLAEHYVDYTEKMTKEEIKELLKVRSKRLEYTNPDYEEYLKNPTPEARAVLQSKRLN